MKYSFAATFLLGCFLYTFSCSIPFKSSLKIGLVIFEETGSDENDAAIRWLEDHPLFEPRLVHGDDEKPLTDDVDVLWIHLPDSAGCRIWIENRALLARIRSLYEGGARILLTDYAALLPHAMGVESVKPEVRTEKTEDLWLFDQRGLQTWRGHPVFKDLFGGCYIWDAFEDLEIPRVGYFGESFPEEGNVVAVEKSYITVHRDRRLMMEYRRARGCLLSVGAFVYFARKNNARQTLESFVQNALVYLNGNLNVSERTYWKPSFSRPSAFETSSGRMSPPLKRVPFDEQGTDLVIVEEEPGDDFFDLAGRRILLMGKERGGVDEVWVHPFRILKDFEAGIVIGDSLARFAHMPSSMEIRPESITRAYRTPIGIIREVVYVSVDKPGAVIHFHSADSVEIELVIRFQSDLRWMWPYDADALGSVHFGYDESKRAFHVRDETGDFYCIYGFDIPPLSHLEGSYADVRFKAGTFSGTGDGGNRVRLGAAFQLNDGNAFCMNTVIVGTDRGVKEAAAVYRNMLEYPLQEHARAEAHVRRLFDAYTVIESPDEEFNRLWKWTLVGTDRFFVETPSLGGAFVAGYGTTARGWNGNHEISGRPGYAWYFGRDAAWTGFAVDDYGDFDRVRDQLAFFQRFQDASGKIFHELSTSGAVHYDAADATPLYIILAAHYLRASGDIKFIRNSWQHIERAIRFLYSTDTDGDGLIENTNVGHGWVEGGSLWGAHTTLYLAGLWARALEDAATMAAQLKKVELAEQYSRDARGVRDTIDSEFWNESASFYHYGKLADGSFNPEKTVLPAVLAHFDLIPEDKAEPILRHLAGIGFSTDWGVRILSSESPLFNPQGYHYGSVWPLYTGWTALAEYAHGNPVQGFSHIMNNLMIKNHWALGFVEEVMNGTAYQPAGVCPHQCWSETNILHPGITGMIGWKPDAMKNTAVIQPRFPTHWKRVAVHHLCIGRSKLGFTMVCSKNETHYDVVLERGKPVHVELFPSIADGMIIDEILLDDVPQSIAFETRQGVLAEPISCLLADERRIVIRHREGASVVPLMPEPVPGAASSGCRLVDSRLEDSVFILDVEGRQSTTCEIIVRIFDQRVVAVQGARIRHINGTGLVSLSVRFPRSRRTPYVQKRVEIRLE